MFSILNSNLIEILKFECHNIDQDVIIYLVGSYAEGNMGKKSDIDFLIISDKKTKLSKIIKKKMYMEFSDIYHKLDIKIISKQDLKEVQNSNYLLIYSLIDKSKLITGNTILLKLSPVKLKKSYNMIIEEVKLVERLIEQQFDEVLIASKIFSLGKSLHYLERILKGDSKNMKEIFQNNLFYLGNNYEKAIKGRKNIQTQLLEEFNIKYRKRENMKNKDKLFSSLELLKDYEKYVQEILSTRFAL